MPSRSVSSGPATADVAGVPQRRLARIERLSTLLDEAFPVPGTRFRIGWDTIIGLVPGVGDVATALLSAWIIYQAHALGLPKRTLLRMAANVGVDTLLGALPLVGDVFDATFKANRKNVRLLNQRLGQPDAGS